MQKVLAAKEGTKETYLKRLNTSKTAAVSKDSDKTLLNTGYVENCSHLILCKANIC